mmetsp:Transcript_21477/g.54488  ORF Transcript_21477/g.54488 Transcript_21477/m.54488 type:complete len:272 (+) Transcript_21477:728-1543(+)
MRERLGLRGGGEERRLGGDRLLCAGEFYRAGELVERERGLELRPIVDHPPSHDEAPPHARDRGGRDPLRVLELRDREQAQLDDCPPTLAQLLQREVDCVAVARVSAHVGQRRLRVLGEGGGGGPCEQVEHLEERQDLHAVQRGGVDEEVLQQRGHVVGVRVGDLVQLGGLQHEREPLGVDDSSDAAHACQIGKRAQHQLHVHRVRVRLESLCDVIVPQLHELRGHLPAHARVPELVTVRVVHLGEQLGHIAHGLPPLSVLDRTQPHRQPED